MSTSDVGAFGRPVLPSQEATALDEIRERRAAATPGPWRLVEDSSSECTVRASGPIVSGVVATVRVAWVHAAQRIEQFLGYISLGWFRENTNLSLMEEAISEVRAESSGESTTT